MASQVGVKGGEGQAGEKLVHRWTAQLIDGQRDRADASTDQLLR